MALPQHSETAPTPLFRHSRLNMTLPQDDQVLKHTGFDHVYIQKVEESKVDALVLDEA